MSHRVDTAHNNCRPRMAAVDGTITVKLLYDGCQWIRLKAGFCVYGSLIDSLDSTDGTNQNRQKCHGTVSIAAVRQLFYNSDE